MKICPGPNQQMWQLSAGDDYSVYILVVFCGFVTVRGTGGRGILTRECTLHGLKSSACSVYPISLSPPPQGHSLQVSVQANHAALPNLFRNYPCLWDASSADYINRNAKDAAYNELLQRLEERGLKSGLAPLKRKIKSVRDTCRNEVYKIKKSKKSGAGADDVYKPRLVWFSAAAVLAAIYFIM
ncbi:hypothetical protein JTB14_010252 [Gonioctena quinquepunctata]|nr:hypothetical protein JTB14_010252 [Gonioctena quinquepunctata]